MKAKEFMCVYNLRLVDHLTFAWSHGKKHKPFREMVQEVDPEPSVRFRTMLFWFIAGSFLSLSAYLGTNMSGVFFVALCFAGALITVLFSSNVAYVEKECAFLEADPKAVWNRITSLANRLGWSLRQLVSAEIEEIKNRAEEVLVYQACLVKYAEEEFGMNSPAFQNMREGFGVKHEVFIDFGLVEADWTEYFKKATPQAEDAYIVLMESLNKKSAPAVET